jgi:hypothetical protein
MSSAWADIRNETEHFHEQVEQTAQHLGKDEPPGD